MTTSLQDMLWEYALGTLSDADTETVEQALAGSADLRRELAETTDALGSLALDAQPILPSASVRERLMTSIGAGAERHAPFLSALQRVFDLSRDAMTAVMQRAEKLTEWEAGPYPGSQLFHFDGGLAVAGADCGLVRFPAGFEHPRHDHLGDEEVVILEGHQTHDDGVTYGPGDVIAKQPGDQHAFRVHDDSDCLIAIRLDVGIEVYMPDGSVVKISSSGELMTDDGNSR